MTVRLGADYMTRVSPSVLHSMGVTFVSRYLSDFPSKNLTFGEASELSANGVDVVSNWEDDVNSWQRGYAGGLRDAQTAWHQHKACGGPDGRPVYFSVDTDVSPQNQTLHDYFRGLGDGMTPGQVGVYGSTGVCRALKAAGLAHWTWRTMSTGWTGGAGDPSEFNVEQTGYFNSNMDRDASITEDFGQWRVGQQAPVPAPTPAPPHPAPPVVSLARVLSSAHTDPPRPNGQTSNYVNVIWVERALQAEGLLDAKYVDGSYGTLTLAAYAAWQRKLGYAGKDADGYPGLDSLSRLGKAHGFLVVG